MVTGRVIPVSVAVLLSLIAIALFARFVHREILAARVPQLVRIIESAPDNSRNHTEHLELFVQELERPTLRATDVRTAMRELLQRQKHEEWRQFVGDAIEAVIASGKAEDHEIRTYLEQIWRLRFRPEYAASLSDRVLILPEWEVLESPDADLAWCAAGYGAYERGLVISVEDIRVDGERVEVPSMTTVEWFALRPWQVSNPGINIIFCVPGMMYTTSPLQPGSAPLPKLLNARVAVPRDHRTKLPVPYVVAGEPGTHSVHIRWRLRVLRTHSPPSDDLSDWEEIHSFVVESRHSLIVQ